MNLKKALASTVGKKFIMALTGLGLVGFVITHLAANLLLMKSDGTSFNTYAYNLTTWGVLLLVAELGLAALFITHIVSAILVKRANASARPQGYRVAKSKGGPSYSNPASRNMFITGMIIFAFLIIHIWQFRFGPGESAGYTTQLKAGEARDLHRLVVETFKNPMFMVFYSVCMIVLGFHLRHGFWSAFQSLGLLNNQSREKLNKLSILLAAIIAGGFLLIPIWIFFDLGTMFTVAG